MAVQDGPVRHLFDNTGDLYYGRGFEMLAALEANFKPATFTHTFTTLLSLVNNKQAEEGIHEFWARFEGHLPGMSWSAVSIPPLLKAMLFLQALHPHYKAMARRMILSQLALDRSLLFFLFPGFLSVFGRFSLFLDGSNPTRLVFPVPFFCWTQGWGVLVRPWSARVA